MATQPEGPSAAALVKADEDLRERISPPDVASQRVTVDTGKRKKKKKRRFSWSVRTLQHFERGVTTALETASDGIARTLRVYNKRRNKSSRKKRDGAIRDGIQNWAKAMSKGMRVAGKVPRDFVKAVNKGGGTKRLRKTVRLLTPPPLR